MCVLVGKREGFVNAAILLWQSFYLTDTRLVTPVFSLLWHYVQLYIFSQIIDKWTVYSGNSIFCFPNAYYKANPMVYNNIMGKHHQLKLICALL